MVAPYAQDDDDQHGRQHHPHTAPLLTSADSVQEAAFCLKDALDRLIRFHPIGVGEPRANWAHRQRLRTLGYLLPWLAIWTLIILTFVETPTWCLRDPSTCDPSTSTSKFYPRVTSRFLDFTTALIIEFIALSMLLLDYLLQMTAEGLPLLRCHPFKRGFWHQLLLLASFFSLLMSALLPTGWTFRGGPFLRILFLVTYSRRLRQELKLVVRILPQFGKALILLLSFLFIYAVLGLSLFSPASGNVADAQEAAIYFPNFRTAFASTWQLFLYWTFPSIMIVQDPESGEYLPPSFVLALYVFSFMILVINLILNFVLAIVVDVYNDQNKDVEKQRKADRKLSLERAFTLLAIPIPSSSSSLPSAVHSSSSSTTYPPPPPSSASSLPSSSSFSSSRQARAIPFHTMHEVLLLLSTFSSVPRLTPHALHSLLLDLTPSERGREGRREGGNDRWVRKSSFMRLPELLASASNEQQQQQRLHRHHYHQRQGEEEEEEQQQQQQQRQQGRRRPLIQVGGEDHEEDDEDEEEEEGERRFVDLWCPLLAGSKVFESVSVFVRSAYLEYFIDAIIIANLALVLAAHGGNTHHSSSTPSTPTPSPTPAAAAAVAAAARLGGGGGLGEAVAAAAAVAADDEAAHPGQTLLSQRDFSLVAAAIFTLEVLAKLFVYGYTRYISSYMNLFDATLTLLTIGGAIYEFSSSSSSSSQLHQPFLVFELLRILRLFRALMAVPQFRTTGHAFLKILPSASSLFLNLFAVTFVFAALGLEAYGGLVNTDKEKEQFSVLASTYYYENGLFIFNFNDLGGGFIILVELLIDASLIQPFYEALGALLVGGGREGGREGGRVGTMAFFVSYYCLGQLVVLNIVVCFILDAFLYEKEEEKDEEEGEEGGREDGAEEEEEEKKLVWSAAAAVGGGGGGGGKKRGGEVVVPVLGGSEGGRDDV